MKTNRISSIRRLAIIVGTLLTASQAAAAVVPAAPVWTVTAEKITPKPTTIALSCTRVGTRMVC